MMRRPRLTIAGLGGDTGKTVLSVGLCRLWHTRGVRVVPFKKGPDYIDMEWLSRAARHPCYNIDLFLMSADQVFSSFCANTGDADIAVIEGNRGLFDGLDVQGSVSTAEVAKLLRSPVILVIDCTKTTRTVAALVRGCQVMDPDVLITGVVLNKVAGSRHESMVRQCVEYYCNVPVVGAIPKLKSMRFPGRHLGLVPPQEHPDSEGVLQNAADICEKFLDMPRIWDIAAHAEGMRCSFECSAESPQLKAKIGVIRDAAFQFYYPENLAALKRAGAELIEFSALSDALPPSLDGLYIGGGFPETHAAALADNEAFRVELKSAADRGLPIYAECGGLMYLSRELEWEGKRYPMVAVFPADIGVSKKPRGHGYTVLETTGANPFFEKGTIIRGHEFHYSYIKNLHESGEYSFAFDVVKGDGLGNGKDGICRKNVLATYTHVHAAGTVSWAAGIVTAAMREREENLSFN